ncbi:MAG: HutD family protein [Kordiimonadaceae bacterium]|nr:HutD family protein [Kordiimonadaceae bacterium]
MGKHLTSADYVSMPWKNGKGTTTELVTCPHKDTEQTAAFSWRISIADMVEDGPFSTFPGIDRTLTVISGHGLTLKGPENFTVACTPLMPTMFSGDLELTGLLREGAVKNFNVMTDRGVCSADVEVQDLGSNAVKFGGENFQVFIYVLEASDPIEVHCDDQLLQVAQGEGYLAIVGALVQVTKPRGCNSRIIAVSILNETPYR